jgi:diguanylate cyclase (GGDEF)-like protein/PAS domain S-box-containing protein
VNRSKPWGRVVIFIAFLAALLSWPTGNGAWLTGGAGSVLPLRYDAFLAVGILAAAGLRYGIARVWYWPLAAALAALPFWAPIDVLQMACFCLATLPTLHFSRLRLRSGIDSPRALLRLLYLLALYPSALLALIVLGLQLLNGRMPVEALTAVGLAWGTAGLALTACVPLALDRQPNARRLIELSLMGAMMIALWFGVNDNSRAASFPLQILLFPMVLWGAFRSGLWGAAALSVLVLVLPPVSVKAADLGLSHLVALHFTDLVLRLAFTAVALIVAVLVEGFRRNESVLLEFQSRFESFLNHSPSFMALKSLDGTYLLVNRAYARQFGLSPNQMVGKRPADLVLAHEAQEIRQHDEQVVRCLEPRQYEEQLTVAGKTSIMLATRFPMFDAQGRLAGLGAISIDITQSKLEEKARVEVEEKYRALVEQSLVGIYIIQHDRMVYCNPKLAAMLGYQVDEVLDQPIDNFIEEIELDRIRRKVEERTDSTELNYSTRVRHKDGGHIDVEIHSRVFDYCGQSANIGVVLDISGRVHADAELKLAAKVFENSAEGIMITDADARIIAVNAAFTRITCYSAEDAIGRVSRMFRDWDTEQHLEMLADLQTVGHWQGELMDRRKSGEWYPAELSISTVRDPSGHLTHFVGVFSDITERKQAEERLQFLANHDALTGLPNRAHMIAALDQSIYRAAGGQPGPALMFIDLDRFKLINDSFGHQAGDQMLRETTARLIRVAEKRGKLARLGGDEFTLLVEAGASSEEMSELAEAILNAVSQPLKIEGHEVYVTGSIGISMFPHDGTDAQTLLKNADMAMYRAKQAGKNTYQFFAAEMNAQTFERLLMENGLRMALERHELELHYQPLINAFNHRIEALEVLVRWRHPQLGLVPPGRFISLAEETGLIRQIGAWVLAAACRQVALWDESGLHIPRIAVNLSARQFEQSSLTKLVSDALSEAGITPSRLELEITESMLMQNPLEAVEILHELKGLGVHLSVDDFGTGYSSLSYLKRFPIDTLKIDRSFVDGLPDDDDSAAITEAILAMSRKLGYSVVAEGVETEAQSHFLRMKGCSLLQGYHFCKPLPEVELEQFVQGWYAKLDQEVVEVETLRV